MISARKEIYRVMSKNNREAAWRSVWGADIEAVTWRINQWYKRTAKKFQAEQQPGVRRGPALLSATKGGQRGLREGGKVQRCTRASAYRAMCARSRDSEFYFRCNWGITFSYDSQLRPRVNEDKWKTSSYKHLETLDKMAKNFFQKLSAALNSG